jgi:hypothetical protein
MFRTRSTEPNVEADDIIAVAGQALRWPTGWAVADLALDRPVLWVVKTVFLPTSRLWASAMIAQGDPDRFVSETPSYGKPDRLLKVRLAGFERWRLRQVERREHWEEQFFASGNASEQELARAEARRVWASVGLATQRLRFADIVARRRIQPVKFTIPTPIEAEAVYGHARRDPRLAFVPATEPRIEESRRLKTPAGHDYWIRFRSASARMADMAWARVREPRGVANPATLVFSNGICIEPDDFSPAGLVRVAPGGIASLAQHGIRVVELELPWHGRRRRLGNYAGEPFLGSPPVGPLDLLSTHAQDLAIAVGWSRQTSTGPVAIAGASLGAVASLLAASHADLWPQRMRPDGLALLTAADDVVGLATSSALAGGLGIPDAMRAAGWTPEALDSWRSFVKVAESAPLPPENIVAALGRRDVVLPFELGASLVARWKLPERNVFVGEAGHFSTQLGSIVDWRPVRRILEILGAKLP